ncbi:hypothetical protein HDU80_009790 [Chytriomyces hyalinus]|nr:hypothetical protein HDU80_009790 [Chytriomyces hyalinus]
MQHTWTSQHNHNHHNHHHNHGLLPFLSDPLLFSPDTDLCDDTEEADTHSDVSGSGLSNIDWTQCPRDTITSPLMHPDQAFLDSIWNIESMSQTWTAPAAAEYPLFLDPVSLKADVAPTPIKPPPTAKKQARIFKNFPCPECSKVFHFPSLLAEHVRSHTGERPFVCSQCDKSYTTNNRLKVHTRSHSNEKPYPCPREGCNYSAKQASDLKHHSIIHLPPDEKERVLDQVRRNYPCVDCNRKFRTEAGLARHKQAAPVCFTNRGGKRGGGGGGGPEGEGGGI